MKPLNAIVTALLVAASWVVPGPSRAEGPTPAAAAASQPQAGQPTGPRQGMGPRGARGGADATPGWAMMSPQEREEHQARMRSMRNRQECSDYMEQHHQRMAERAKAQGRAVPARPRRDPCTRLPA